MNKLEKDRKNMDDRKKVAKKFGRYKKIPYLCNRYPEYNLFTLMKRLIPIENNGVHCEASAIFMYTQIG